MAGAASFVHGETDAGPLADDANAAAAASPGATLDVEARAAEGSSARPWLPAGKTAAVVLSIDDVHPATSSDRYEAGGDLEAGALGRLTALQRRHPRLKATLCVTPDWRLDSLVPDAWPRRLPWLGHRVHWMRRHPKGRFRLDRHLEFAAWLNRLERCEIVPHGLTHSHAGPRYAVEFQEQSLRECKAVILESIRIFESAGVRLARGFVPPAWEAPPALLGALGELGFHFVSSARDIATPIAPDAVTSMSGLKGVSLIHPQIVGRALVHLTCNFQATSRWERACEILDAGGVLHVKAHVFKAAGGHVMLDGLDDAYGNYLDLLFSMLERRYGERLWWAHLSEIAARMRDAS
jgi:hypothetical protein